MPIVVQKFGGTSVADAARIHLAARRAVRALLAGNQVVLVVSAMGHTTDKLVRLAYQVSRRPAKRELDMLLATGEQVSIALLAMAIHEAGYDAISLTGAQVGLLTDSAHTEARIQSIDADRIRRFLDRGRFVIVAGFQGVDPERNITTLGRGGSDTTAVALAAALGAACEIYTDVDGVYTADPRIVPHARRLETISYDEMLELASLGAGVMHSRAMEVGKKYDVPIHVRSSFTDGPGTLIMNNVPGMEDVVVRGAALKRDVRCVTLGNLPNTPAVTAAVFEALAAHNLLVDDIMQTVVADGREVTLGFTVPGHDAAELRAVGELLAQRLGAGNIHVAADLARVSVVGVGMRSHVGVAARLFGALAAANIPVQNIATSEIVISALVPDADGERALQAAHAAFGLADAT